MSSSAPELATFNPFSTEFHGWELFDELALLREQDPPVALDVLGRPWFFRYADVNQVLLDKERFLVGETIIARSMGFESGAFYDFLDNGILTQNPPDHTRIRRAAGYFSKHLVKGLEPMIRMSCDALIDSFPDEGIVEFSHDFAFKLPVGVIMALLNLPAEDEQLIHEWTPKQLPHDITPEARATTDAANKALREYAEHIIDDRLAHPIEGDIVTELGATFQRGELSRDELWALVVSLIVAGHETTSSALALGLYMLLVNPDQLDKLRENRSLAVNATEEILRHQPPVDNTLRVPAEDVELHGVSMAAGSVMGVSLAAANRDPRQFGDPDAFDISRPNARQHVSFSAGIHRCVGAPLSQLEIPVALNALLDRLDRIELAGEVIPSRGSFRGLATLPISVKRSS